MSVLPELDLCVRQALLSQVCQFLLPVLQGLELGETPHPGCLLPKGPIDCSWGKALPLGDTPEEHKVQLLLLFGFFLPGVPSTLYCCTRFTFTVQAVRIHTKCFLTDQSRR